MRRTLYARYLVFLDVIPWALTRRTEHDSAPVSDDDDRFAVLTAIGRDAPARALDSDTLRLRRIAMSESARFLELATSAHSMTWPALRREVMDALSRQQTAGAIAVDDLEVAAGHFLALAEHLPECGICCATEEEERQQPHADKLFVRGVRSRR